MSEFIIMPLDDHQKSENSARHPCLTPMSLATWEAEIRRITTEGGQLGQNVNETSSQSIAGCSGTYS
jgi:hypothetical protein